MTMATYAQLYQAVVQGGPVINRATVAVAVAAQAVLIESDQTVNHAARLAWARKALDDPGAMVGRMAYAIAGNGVVGSSGDATTDAQLLTAVNGLIDAFALV
jgi:hypothetical protein